jgi:surface protein
MQSMFNGCLSLKSLNVSSFDTSEVNNMEAMFYNCIQLTSLDLSNFNTQSVTNMESMFSRCINLNYINFYNFNDESLIFMINIFLGIKDNAIICFKKELNKIKIKNELSKLKCPTLICSENWKEYKKKIIYNTGNCTDDCISEEKFEYEYNCYDECPKGTHSSINHNYLCEKNVDKCINKSPFISTENNSCALSCSSEDFFNKKCTLNNYNIENKRTFINNIINDIENDQINGLISEYLRNRKDLIIVKNETLYQITSSWNQNNNQYNIISFNQEKI